MHTVGSYTQWNLIAKRAPCIADTPHCTKQCTIFETHYTCYSYLYFDTYRGLRCGTKRFKSHIRFYYVRTMSQEFITFCDIELTEVFLTLTEVFRFFFLSCKANARVKLAKTGHGPHSSTLVVICVVRLLFVFFYVLFVYKCVLTQGDNPIAVNKYIISFLLQRCKSDLRSSRILLSVDR
jgi:hypothetical protein